MTTKLQKKKGSVFGGALLVAGCCIGAGMLGLPVVTATAGFGPSIVMFVGVWLFLVCTGFLMLEVNLWLGCDVSIVTMAERTLGRIGKAVAWGTFLFIFYSLMVAYIAGSGALFADFFEDFANAEVSPWIGNLFFTLLFALLIYIGTTAVDKFNRVLMLALMITYALLVSLGVGHIKKELLSHVDLHASMLIIPVIIVSFGYHNLIPSLTNYLAGDSSRLRKTIILGSVIPLIVYVVWQAIILGIVPLNGEGGFLGAIDQGEMATRALRKAAGSPLIVEAADYFSFFAIITSLLSVALSFVDFLADGLNIKKSPKGKIALCSLVLLPPWFLATRYTTIFLSALTYAGIGAMVLFGIMPALMVWVGRYKMNMEGRHLVKGGRASLIIIITVSLMVIALKVLQQLHWI